MRHLLTQYGAGDSTKSLIGGGCASLVGQTIIVPFDVISQHAMVLGMGEKHKSHYKKTNPATNVTKSLVTEINPLGIAYHNRSRMRISIDIATAILQKDGFRGYYRGYLASLMAYVPNSALWWTFYHLYQGTFENLLKFFITKLTKMSISLLQII